MRALAFARSVSEYVKTKGVSVDPWGLLLGLGFTRESPYIALYHLERLGFVDNGKLTEKGRELVDIALTLANIIVEDSPGYWPSYSKVLGHALYILVDWRTSMRSSEEALEYAKRLLKTLRRLKEEDEELYRDVMIRLPRYDFEDESDPLTLIKELRDVREGARHRG